MTLQKLTASKIRVHNHNNWPAIELFQCEKQFFEKMAKNNIQQVFVTASMSSNDGDQEFNSAISHILDCLSLLPMRPDLAFDALYKVIDKNLGIFGANDRSPVKNAVSAFFNAHCLEWTTISQTLCESIPQQTADYAASRMLDCYIIENPPHTDRMKARATRSLGEQRYEQFRNKFLFNNPQNPRLFELPDQNRRNAGRLLRRMLQLTEPLQGSQINEHLPQDNILNLANRDNILSADAKIECLWEICLATYRHERFHGETFSPFRSSKATLKTYAHAYFLLMVSYIVVLGLLYTQDKGGLEIHNIVDVAKKFADRFTNLFKDVLDE